MFTHRHLVIQIAVLCLGVQSASADKGRESAWLLRAELGQTRFQGALLERQQGAVAALDFADAFAAKQNVGLALGYQFADQHELALTLNLIELAGKQTSFGSPSGLTIAAELSDFETLKTSLDYRFYFVGYSRSGAFLGASLGQERRNAVSATVSNGAVSGIFASDSALAYRLTAGYQWRIDSRLSLSLTAAWERNPALQLAPASSALGLIGTQSEASWRVPIALQLSYHF